MLTKKKLAAIRKRFEDGGADGPLRIQGDHFKDEGQVIDLGWSVLGTSKLGNRETTIQYASHTTFEAATFLVHLPVDMANMLQELERYHLLLAGVVKGDEEAIHHAKHIIGEKVRDLRKPSHCCGAQGFGEPGDVCPGCEERCKEKPCRSK
ncbi:hypothetical protein LCGC14_2076050 [marine sediment metagenome]|uniref:Uncharacterized protein n=1 Tax=marine sediment metagenome TaxID=412755 RepID=A0A0F9EH83_9ZZZZ